MKVASSIRANTLYLWKMSISSHFQFRETLSIAVYQAIRLVSVNLALSSLVSNPHLLTWDLIMSI